MLRSFKKIINKILSKKPFEEELEFEYNISIEKVILFIIVISLIVWTFLKIKVSL